MNLAGLLQNHVLLTGLAGWILAQALKNPDRPFPKSSLELGSVHSSRRYAKLAFRAGYLHCCCGWVALWFRQPLLGVAVALAMIVVYDATGIRRQAGMQAQKINILVEEL